MMGASFENMDGVFRKQLRDYSQIAPEGVWDNIEDSLNANKKVKRITFYRVAAAIAAFALIGASYFYFTNQKDNINTQTAGVEESVTPIKENKDLVKEEKPQIELEISNKSDNEATINENKKLLAEANIRELGTKAIDLSNISENNKSNRLDDNIEKLGQKEISIANSHVEAKIVDTRKQKVQSILNSLPSIYDNSYAINDLNKEKPEKKGKWIMGGEFTPLYSYRNITNTSGTYSEDFYNSTEKPVMSYTGGLNLQYKAIDRLTIQAGVYYTTMGQSFDYMSVYANAAYDLVDEQYKDRFINSYAIVNSSGNVAFNSQYVIVDDKSARVENLSTNKAVADVSDPIYNNLGAEIEQSFQYVEVPFLMRYKIIDRTVDINILGGFGANFLIGNDVFLKYADNKEVIGKTEGVSTINYNGTFGFGIEYPIMKRINIRLEPSIKYYINEINSNSSVESHPYSVGIYTGINYSF